MKTTLLLIILLCAGLFCSLNSYANTYYWTGSTNSNWSTLANWNLSSCGGSTPVALPGTGDSVVFSGGCSNNNCTIDVAISILSFRIDGSYTGTISQSSGNAITATYGKFADGTFTGSNAAITFSTSLIIEGGTFTTTSGTTTIKGNFSYTGGTFNANNGRVVFYKTLTVSGVNSSSSISLYDVEFQAIAGNTTVTLSNIILNVADSTLLTGSEQLFIDASQSTSVINASGEVKDYNTSGTGGGDATIVVNGSSTQHITGNVTTEDVGKLPNLTINSTGTVYLIGYITMGGSTTLTYTAGTINAGTSDVVFYYDNTITGGMTFNNVEFQGTGSTYVVSNTITVNGNVYTTLTGSVVLNTGTVNLYGSYYISNTGSTSGGSATINFTGTANDSISASSGVAFYEGMLPYITINKTGGTLYLSGNISVAGNWTNNYTTSGINPGTSNVFFYYNSIGGTYSTPLWNVSFGRNEAYNYTVTEDSALIIKNNLTIIGTDNFYINGYSFNIYGNIVNNTTAGGDYGTTVFNLVGSANDSIISSSGITLGESYLPSVTINKTGGTLYLKGIISVNGNWTNNYSQANINPGTSTVFFNNDYFSIGGTYSTPLWNAEFGSGEPWPYTITEDSALIIKNNLTIRGDNSFSINDYSFNIYGNIIDNSTGGGDYGSTVFNLVGSENDSIISASGIILGESYFPSITVGKTGGTLYLNGIISVNGNWTNNYSQANINPGTSTVFFNNDYFSIGGTYSTPLWNAEFGGGEPWPYTVTEDSALIIKNDLTIRGDNNFSINDYSFNIYGNVIDNSTGGGDYGTTVFNLVGSANDSIISTSGITISESYFPSITIDKTGGTLYLIGNISEYSNWTNNYSKININPGTSSVFFNIGTSIGGTYSTPLWNVLFGNNEAYTNTIEADSAIIVKNNLTLRGNDNFYISGYSIPIYGNIIVNNKAGETGTTIFNLVGSENDSIIYPSTYNLGQGYIPAININKTGGTLYLIGNISEYGNWTYIKGNVNAGISNVGMGGSGYTLTGSGSSMSMSFNNLIIGGNTTLASTLYVGNNLTINSTKTLNTSSSNYPIKLAGNWINNGTFYPNNSDVTFNGSLTDSIKGSGTTSFYSLTLNKTGTLYLADPVTVADSLNLTSGDILSSSTNLLTLNNGSLVTGGSDNSFVSGPIKKIGNSAFTFPTGAGSSYHPIGITAPSSTSDAFEAQYFNTAPTGRAYTDDSLTYVSACDYWLLSQPTGSSSNVTVSLFWGTNSCAIKRLSSLRVGYFNTSNSKWTDLGQSATTGTTTSGSVTATATSSLSSTADTFAISKHSLTPTVSAGTPATICYGTSDTIGGTPTATGGFSPYTYSWSPATGLSSSTAANPSATPTATTTYTVTVEDNDNAPTATSNVVVTVDLQLFVNAGLNNTIYYGTTDTLGSTPTASGGTSPYTYNWAISDSTISTLARPVVSPTTTTTYLLIVTDSVGCVAYSNVVITVIPQLQANGGAKQGICGGQSIIIGGSPSAIGGIPPYTYSWSNGIGVFSYVAYPRVAPTSSTTYTLTVTDAGSHTSTAYDTVTVSPSVIANPGGNTTAIPGGSITLSGSATGGTSPFSYSWFPSTGLSSVSVSNPTASPQSSTLYTLEVTDTNGCNSMKSMSVQLRFPSQGMASTFALLADDSVKISSNDTLSGDVGAHNSVSSSVTASNIYIGSNSTLTGALTDLTNEVDTISVLSGTTIADGGTINGAFNSGVYNVTGNITMADTLTINGDSTSYFILIITGNLTVNSNATIQLGAKVNPSQVLIYAGGNITINNPAYLQGRFLASGNITGGNIISNGIAFQSLGKLIFTHISGGKNLIPPAMATSGTITLSLSSTTNNIGSLPNFFGYNIDNIKQPDDPDPDGGFSDPGFIENIPQMNSTIYRLLNSANGGNYEWDWNYGKFQDSTIVLYNATTPTPLNAPPLYSTFSPLTQSQNFPEVSNKITDGKLTFDGENAAPLFNLDMLTNNEAYNLLYLKEAHALKLPIHYIELGNEYWGEQNGFGQNGSAYDRFPDAQSYVVQANQYLDSIHLKYDSAHVALPAKFYETHNNVPNSGCRSTTWVAGYGLPNVCSSCSTALHLRNHDALSFHVYLGSPLTATSTTVPSTSNLPAFFAQPFDEVQYFTNTAVKMCQNNGGITIDPWITEYNLDKQNSGVAINGTWAHGLLTAAMTLAFLEQPAIKHLTCETMARYADQSMVFVNQYGFTKASGIALPPSSLNTIQWGLSASGTTMQLVGEAMRNCSIATKINFNATLSSLPGALSSYPVLYGWEFISTSSEKQGVIINFDSISHNIDPTGVFTTGSTLGYDQISAPNINGTLYPFCYVTGAYVNGIYHMAYYTTGSTQPITTGELIHTGPTTYSSSTLVLPAYSITRIYQLKDTISATQDKSGSVTLSTINSSGGTYYAGNGNPINSTAINLCAEGANTYLWTSNDTHDPGYGLSDTTASSVTFYPSTPGSYTVTCTASGNCSICSKTSSSITVSTTAPPTVTTTTDSSGQNVTASAGSANDYWWSPTQGIYNSAHTANVIEGASVYANPLQTTTYIVTAIDTNNGFFATANNTVSQNNSRPVINIISPSGGAAACGGSTIKLQEPTGTFSTYKWRNETTDSVLTASTTNTLTLLPGSKDYPKSDSWISLTVTNSLGYRYKNMVYITTDPNLMVDIPINPICDGNSVDIEVSGADSYKWSPSSGLSTTTGSQVVASPTDTTSYNVVGSISSGSCSGSTDTVHFTINVAGSDSNPTFSVASPHTILNGCSVTIIASPGGSAHFYSWLPGEGLSNVIGDTVMASPTVSTIYRVYEDNIAENVTGCCGTRTITINVDSLTASASPSTICTGSSSTLSVGAGEGSLASYTWSPSTGLSATTGSSVTATPTVATTYTVSACSGEATAMVTLKVNPLPDVSVSFVDTAFPYYFVYCSCDTPTMIASGASTYTWAPATGLTATTGSSVGATPTALTVYTVTGTDSHGCKDTASAGHFVVPQCFSYDDSDYYCYDCLWCPGYVEDMKEKIDTSIIPTSGTLKIYPNPNNGSFTLNIFMGDSSSAPATVDIYNMMGSLIYNSTISLSNGFYQGSFSYPNLPSGMYFIIVYKDQRTMHTSFNITH